MNVQNVHFKPPTSLATAPSCLTPGPAGTPPHLARGGGVPAGPGVKHDGAVARLVGGL